MRHLLTNYANMKHKKQFENYLIISVVILTFTFRPFSHNKLRFFVSLP